MADKANVSDAALTDVTLAADAEVEASLTDAASVTALLSDAPRARTALGISVLTSVSLGDGITNMVYTPGSIPFANQSGVLMENNHDLNWSDTARTLTLGNSQMSGSPTLGIGMNAGNNAALFQASANKKFKFYNGAYGLVLAYSGASAIGYAGVNNQNPAAALDVASTEANNAVAKFTHSVGTGAGNVNRWGLNVTENVTATDGAPQSQGTGTYRGVTVHGLTSTDPGGPVYATGAAGGIASEVYIKNVKPGNGTDESSCYFGSLSYWTEPASTTPGRGWFTDWSIHGPVGVRPDALSGQHMVINNYYNGNPITSPSGAAWFLTHGTSGAGKSPTQIASLTYPVQVGVGIIGFAGGVSSPTQGFVTALQIGGTGGNWGVEFSRMGTGALVRDYDVAGVVLGPQYSGTAAASLRVVAGGGAVDLGGLDGNGHAFVNQSLGDKIVLYGNTFGVGVQAGALAVTVGVGSKISFRTPGAGPITNGAEFASIDSNGFLTGVPSWFPGRSQATVGVAGGASALPATPTGYLPIRYNGVTYVIPYYAAS